MATPAELAAIEEDVTAVFDYSTLTGSMLNALGSYHYGLVTRDHKDTYISRIVHSLIKGGEIAHEKLHRLHYDPQSMKNMMKAHTVPEAIPNIGSTPEAGYLDGFNFLQAILEKIPLIHIDMAGALGKAKSRAYYQEGSVFNAPPVMGGARAFEDLSLNSRYLPTG